METIPQIQSGESEKATGITCPDCPGVLGLTLLEKYPHFRCRIGHTYSFVELVRAKESRLEDLLWAPVTAFEELAALLTEALAMDLLDRSDAQFAERAELARQQAAALRALIESDVVTAFSPSGVE